MEAQIHCSQCGEQKAVLEVFINPVFALDATRCTVCGRTVCGEGHLQFRRLFGTRRDPKSRSGPPADRA